MRIPLATAALALALAVPVHAAPILHVRADGSAVVRHDRHLPSTPDLGYAPFGGARASGARLGRAAGGGRKVKKELRRARDAGEITVEQYREWRATLREAQRVRKVLTGARRIQMAAQLAVLYTTAKTDRLSSSRMPALFLQLARNTEFWRTQPYPYSGQRVSFSGSKIVFQYYPGYGLQIQPLANFGKANALWRSGKEKKLRKLLDELVAIAARRGRFTTWEYWFHFGGGSPPWTSAMAQGTAMQALSRGYELLGDETYLLTARRGIRAFTTPAPLGVRTAGRDGGKHYLIYSFSTGLRVLNAFAQTLNGLFDYATISGHARALRLFDKGERSLRAELADYDTGAWSLYSLGGAEATTEYHGLASDFLGNLCDRLGPGTYCDAATRFELYEEESPRMKLRTRRLKKGNTQYVRFDLSKRSTVQMTISRKGKVVYSASAYTAYGRRAFVWRPTRRGEHAVTLSATSFHGTQGSEGGTITVR